MRNILHKSDTLRTAVAESRVSIPQHLLEKLQSRVTEKGDALEIARVAAVMGAKKTWEIIPFCHQIPIAQCDVKYTFEDRLLVIEVTAGAVATTGVEMEALTAAAICALTIYDMMKPYDADVEILGTRLLEKKGGKSDFTTELQSAVRIVVAVVSETVHKGKKPDSAGALVRQRFSALPNAQLLSSAVLSGDETELRDFLRAQHDANVEIVFTVGGTGFGDADRTVPAVESALDTAVPGICEMMRSYGQRRTPRAMMSRAAAGFMGDMLIVTLPGSSRGASESLDALIPHIFHAVEAKRKSKAKREKC